MQSTGPSYQAVQVGRVTVVAPPDRMSLGLALGELADQPREFVGLGRWEAGPLRLVLAPSRSAIQRFGRGRVPNWGIGLAFPSARVVVVRADAPDPRGALRHELAHLALHDRIRSRVPLWFDEGYSVVAAGELSRLLALELNLAVVRGATPELRELDASLRRAEGEAQAAYALAGSAVLHLFRLVPGGSPKPLFDRLATGEEFATAVESVTGYPVSGFEQSWRRDLRRRYGWLVWLAAGGVWAVAAAAVIALGLWRRRRDRPRRAALDQGWELPAEEEDPPLDPDQSAR